MQGKQMRYSDEELQIIKDLFSNEKNLFLLRKVFLPEILPNAPAGQNVDLWLTLKLDEQTPEQALINIKARNNLIAHIEGCLLQLSILSGNKNETVEETKKRLIQNSSK